MTNQRKFEKPVPDAEDPASGFGEESLLEKLPQVPLRKVRSVPSRAGWTTSERKLATVLTAAIPSSGFGMNSLDARTEGILLSRCFECFRRAVETYSGILAEFSGTSITAVFGVPTIREDDAERACRAASKSLQLLEEISTANPDWPKPGFGIDTGDVTAVTIGDENQPQVIFTGEAVKKARKLKYSSNSGEILVSRQTYQMTSHQFDFRKIDPIEDHDGTERIVAYSFSGAKSASLHTNSINIRGESSRLIGREAELRVLGRRVERLMQGQGRFVSIIGEAGIGKSRLIAELRNQVLDPHAPASVQWLEASAVPMGNVVSYWLFRQLVWAYAGITEQDHEDGVWNKLRDRLETSLQDRFTDAFPYLATMISLDVRQEFAEQVSYLNAEAMRRQVFFSSRLLFEKIARRQPLVLLFEDLQWVDESSALLIQHLLPLMNRVPILMFGISRPAPDSLHTRLIERLRSAYHDRYDEIHLSRLTASESAQLVSDLLQGDHHDPVLRNTIAQKAEGNPFFVQEIFRSLVEQGIIRRDSPSREGQITERIDTMKVPLTVQGIIMARLDSLDDKSKEIVKTASVIGRSFLYRVLLAVSESADELQPSLSTIEDSGLIIKNKRSPETAYMFNHDLAHEAIYESVHDYDRMVIHGRVGSAIEQLFGNRLEEFYGLLAYHYSKAENWDKAQKYLFKAGDQAGCIAADAEALTCYTRAAQAYVRAFGDNWSPLQQARLERKMGEAYFRSGKHRRALEHLHQCLAYLGKPMPASRKGIWLRLFSELVKQAWNRVYSANRALLEISPEIEEETRVHEIACWIQSYKSVEQFLLHSLAYLNISEREGHAYGMAAGYTAAGLSNDFLGYFRAAEHYFRLALDLAQRTGHPFAIAYANMGLALHGSTIADWDRALVASNKAAKFFKQMGDLRSWAYVRHVHSIALAYCGRYSSALNIAGEMTETAENSGDPEAMCWGKWMAGYASIRLGRLQEAKQSLQEAELLARSVKNPVYAVGSRHELAVIDLRRNRLDTALSKVRKIERMLLEDGATQNLCIPSHNVITEAYLRQAEESKGTERDDWLYKARIACRQGLRHSRSCLSARPEASRLKGTCQWLMGRRRLATYWWKRALISAERSGQRPDVAIILREMGHRLQEQGYLDRAERISVEFEEDSIYTR